MFTPGANSDMSGETFENEATPSDSVVAPTVIAVEIQAGEFRPLVSPPLPAATTVAMHAERKLSMTVFVGSVSEAVAAPPSPRLMVPARILRVPRPAYDA